ncbi:hypothetical protein WJX72_005056 [[Myrmecia] bisecta]|uniref:Uncharacterized protein n=1 Tax=[Myrmecia] bisecta TaxID=41462 RepID=A0AAW1Q3Y5_9CHLO
MRPGSSSDRNIPANISNTEALTRTLSEISKAEGRVAKSTNVILGELGGQGETSQEKWRQLDEKVNTYPMQREFKAIGTGGDDFAQAVVAAISESTLLIDLLVHICNTSPHATAVLHICSSPSLHAE